MSAGAGMIGRVGASEWSYVTPYRGGVEASLRELRERVFRDGGYYWFWEQYPGDAPLPRPATMDEIWETETMRATGTHSILDVDQVLATTDPPVRGNLGDYETVRPLAPERVRHHFGTARPTRAQFAAVALDLASPGHQDLMGELRLRSAGLYTLLCEGDAVTDVDFWGYSGD
jgi:hypothetical protein